MNKFYYIDQHIIVGDPEIPFIYIYLIQSLQVREEWSSTFRMLSIPDTLSSGPKTTRNSMGEDTS